MSEIEWKIEDNAPEPHVQIRVGDEWHWAGDSEVVALIRAAVEAEREAMIKWHEDHCPALPLNDLDDFRQGVRSAHRASITAIRARGEG